MLCWSNGFRLVSVTLIKRSFSRRAALAPLGRKKDPKLGFNLRTRPTEGLQLAELDYKNGIKAVPIDDSAFQADIDLIRSILHIQDFSFSVWLCSDPTIRSYNAAERQVDHATDILSFQLCDFVLPEVLPRALPEHERYLGDILISPKYIQRVIKRDQQGQVLDEHDAGVSKAMSTVFSVQERLPLLMIHGLLHLLGYDHENDQDWKVMTAREQEVIDEYKRRKAEAAAEGGIADIAPGGAAALRIGEVTGLGE